MGLRENLRDSFKKGSLSLIEIRHPSRAYERYFEGHMDDGDKNAKRRRDRARRTYIAEFYYQNLPNKKRKMIRVLYILLFVMAAALFMFCASSYIEANTVWYVTLPQAASVLSLCWMALGLMRYCAAPKEMKVRQYKESVTRFRLAVNFSAIALGTLSLAYLSFAMFGHAEALHALLRSFCSLIACVCALAIFFIEIRVHYTERENPLSRQEKSEADDVS